MARTEDNSTIVIRGDEWPDFAVWLSWSLHCYGCGVSDARRRTVVVASIAVALGVVAGVALGSSL